MEPQEPFDDIRDLDRRGVSIYLYVTLICIIIVAVVGFQYRSSLFPAFERSGASKRNADLNAIWSRLEMRRELPPVIAGQHSLIEKLDRLNRETCDKSAASLLADGLGDNGYPREAADLLISVGKKCNNEDALPICEVLK